MKRRRGDDLEEKFAQRFGHDLDAGPYPLRGQLLALLGQRDQQAQPALRQQTKGQPAQHARGEQHVLVARHRRKGAGAGIDQHIAAVALLLLYEHMIISPKDMRRMNAAFFTLNGVISVVFFGFVAVDVLMRR